MFSWFWGEPTHCTRCWRVLAECEGHPDVEVVAAPAEPVAATNDPHKKTYVPDWAVPVEKAK